MLEQVWKGLRADSLFGSAAHEILRLPQRMLGLLRAPSSLRSDAPPERLYGLVDTRRLERVVRRAIPWPKIRDNLAAGRLEAASVAATEISTGRVVVFVDGPDPDAVRWTLDASTIARPTRLGPVHALASAAIPVLFPAVRIDGTYYADGGIRLNTPLSPALRLGADRVLVLALRKGATVGKEADVESRRVEHYGNPLFLFGKVLNALLLDHIDTDLARMRLLNDVLRRVRSQAGPAMLDRINETVIADRGQPFKIVDDLVLHPSEDLGLIAGEVAQHGSDGERGSASVRLVIRALGFGDGAFEADFLSYLFFDAIYTRRLLALGFEDAEREEASLAAFFTN
jgi:NTE family protein